MEELKIFIQNIQAKQFPLPTDEAATKQGIILRILYYLGWDNFNINEIYPEYDVGDGKVDYALRFKNNNLIFLEAKKLGENLEKHQPQLLNYSFKYGVNMSILTNGITWWFYLPLLEGDWEDRRFYTIELYDQNVDDIVNKFGDFLLKSEVITGKAVENAKKIHRSKQKNLLIKKTLPEAWVRLISEPDDLLMELIAETTEKLCGYKPDDELVMDFISSSLKTNMSTHVKDIPKTVSNINKDLKRQLKQSVKVPTYFYIKSKKGAKACAEIISQKEVIIQQGSEVATEETPSIPKKASKVRRELQENKTIINNQNKLIFSQNYKAPSLSAAAEIILGRSANGWTVWKDENKRSAQMYREDIE
ncbi:MAG: DUF4357 domain-containing protein [Deltaproteobacteria bacterium]|nr:DUF4357 domain-containing protein [Deltaproteobacteria bacterium]